MRTFAASLILLGCISRLALSVSDPLTPELTQEFDFTFDECRAIRDVRPEDLGAPRGQGMILHLPLNESANATQFRDSSPTLNHAACVATCPQAGLGAAEWPYVQFNGGTQGISPPASPSVGTLASWTWSMWIATHSYTNGAFNNGAGTFFQDRNGATLPLYSLKAVGNQYCLQTRYDNNTGLQCTFGPTISLNRWVYIVVMRVYPSQFRIYADGLLVGTATDTGLALTVPIPKLGNHTDGAGGFFGKMSDFKVYNRQLTRSEIVLQYRQDFCRRLFN